MFKRCKSTLAIIGLCLASGVNAELTEYEKTFPQNKCLNALAMVNTCKVGIESHNTETGNATASYLKLIPAASLTPNGVENITEIEAADALNKLIIVVDGYETTELLLSELPGFTPAPDPFTHLTPELYGLENLVANEGVSILFVRSDLHKNGDSMRDNVIALSEALWYVEFSRSSQDIPYTIIGYSMGGAVARQTLSKLEAEYPNNPHRANLLITYDAPHQGINIPVSLQNTIPMINVYAEDAYELVMGLDESLATVGIQANLTDLEVAATLTSHTFSTKVNELSGNTLNTFIGKQLTIVSAEENFEYPAYIAQTQEHAYPTKVKTIAVTNGSITGISQATHPMLESGEYFNFHGEKGSDDNYVFFDFNLYSTTADALSIDSLVGVVAHYEQTVLCKESLNPLDLLLAATVAVSNVAINGLNAVIKALNKAPFINLPLLSHLADPECTTILNANASTPPRVINAAADIPEIDIIAGGYVALPEMLKKLSEQIETAGIFNKVDFNANKSEFVFLPTYSALDVNVSDTSAPVLITDSPFDAVYSTPDYIAGYDNVPHAFRNVFFLTNEISYFLQNSDTRFIEFVNSAAMSANLLITKVGLPEADAAKIMMARAGADGMLNTIDDIAFSSISDFVSKTLLGRGATSAIQEFVHTWSDFTSPVESKLLGFLNFNATAENLELDAGILVNIATAIIMRRNGDDGIPNTPDDSPFNSVNELLAVEGVDESVITTLLNYAQLSL